MHDTTIQEKRMAAMSLLNAGQLNAREIGRRVGLSNQTVLRMKWGARTASTPDTEDDLYIPTKLEIRHHCRKLIKRRMIFGTRIYGDVA